VDRLKVLEADADWWAQAWPGIERLFAVPAQKPEQVAARFHDDAPELVERVNLDRSKAGGGTMMSAMWALREFDIAVAVARITAPALLLFGTAGPTFGAVGALHAALPAATLEVIEGAGHFPMVDHPAAFADAVGRFIRRYRDA
jgi:pimeloyl-ACP methyl ester carboxylesterase